MGKKIATPFLKSEAQAKQEWLGHLLDDDHVPLDVAYKATCQIQREYYPYAIYSVTCSGDWSATSIWEHVEEYQVPGEKRFTSITRDASTSIPGMIANTATDAQLITTEGPCLERYTTRRSAR